MGKAVLPLKRILSAKSPCNGHYQLEIRTSTLADAVRERETDDTVVGSLEVGQLKNIKHLTLWCFGKRMLMVSLIDRFL